MKHVRNMKEEDRQALAAMKSTKIEYKDLSKKEKRDFIWTYYKLHIIGSIVVLIVLGSLFNSFVLNPAPKVILDITALTPMYDLPAQNELKAIINKVIVPTGENKTVLIEHLMQSENMAPDMQMAITSKFFAKASSGELDIMIVTKSKMEELVSESSLYPLDDWINTNQLTVAKELQATVKDPVTSTNQIYGIEYKNQSVVFGTDEPLYLTVFVASKRLDTALETLNNCFNLK